MTDQTRKPRVAVVFGGVSSEHSISCISAGSVLKAIDREKYDVVPIGITTTGTWVLENPDANPLALGEAGELPMVVGEQEVALSPGETSSLVMRPGAAGSSEIAGVETLGEVDVVFPVMHGPFGQDGTLQGLLEMAGVRYVGAGVLSSAVGTDKAFMKLLFEAQDLPVLPYVVITPRDWSRDEAGCRNRIEELGFPVFVKPARAGSSFGISRVNSVDQLDAALDEARRFDPKVIVEAAAIGAREVECGVLQGEGNEAHLTSELAEIRVDPHHQFYDFEAKYLPEENTALDVPAKLEPELADRVKAYAVRAFEALDVEGLARVDFFVFDDGRIVLNEVETMPGFTSLSMFPRMWAASGVDYPELVDRLIRLALARDLGLR
ncbi:MULTISPECIES: D-alanine--D-alanine ligase family protein [unclassified Nocardioides]|uniref:D-alanine--D-alanine ligase family protein n=1 Tax=unclassified Nocardioides TaxID=2615069 RepID=UPI0006F95819|nr:MULTISPECIES: D-alanine--D-alanine ligase family protein [unclassified Nocardioides]KQY63793.1 D-alanine--D-alanine ligase [Nocardioides sp. Root140]KQZ69714.1 D-alanine--D-alanine ligase [Nocardioides sp. Root151]KRF15806.1 D-alanine--D-alanine ligase [Nocardioides sp. Soil796]